MANDYFNPVTTQIPTGVRALAAQVNNIASSISLGFDKLPTEVEFKLGTTRYAVDTGVADAYIVTLPYVPTLTDGFNFSFKSVNANTGASTINVNGTGVKSIVNPDGTPIGASTFGANAIAILAYESVGDRFILVSQNPGQAALAQASADAAAASAGAAFTSEGNAATSETNAAASEAAAEAAYDSFDDRYLGPKASDPALDNDGNALIDGALYWNTTDSPQQMYGYDGDATQWEAVFASGDAATLDGIDSTGFVQIDSTQVVSPVGNAIHINNQSATYVAQFTQFGSNAGGGINITDVPSNSGTGLNVSHDGTGQVATFSQNNIGASSPVVSILQDHASSTAVALNIQQDGTGLALSVDSNGSGGAVTIDHNSTGAAESALAIDVHNLGRGIFVTNESTANPAELARFYSNQNTLTGDMVAIVQDQAGSTADCLGVQVDGTGNGISVVANSPSGTAARFYSNAASRTQPLIEIISDNSTGLSGTVIEIQNDQGGIGINLQCANTGAAGYAIDSAYAGTSAGHRFASSNVLQTGANLSASTLGLNNAAIFTSNNASRVLSSATVVISDQNAGSSGDSLYINHAPTAANSRGIDLNVPGTGNQSVGMLVTHSGTGTGTGVQVLLAGSGNAFNGSASAAAGTAARFTASAASRTQPVVEIISDNATGSGTALLVQNDQSGPAIDVTAGTIRGQFGNEVDGLFVQKTATESVTSSTTLQADDDLTVTLEALTSYAFMFVLQTTCSSVTPQLKYRWAEADGYYSWGGTSMVANGSAAVAGDDDRGATTQVVGHAVSGQSSVIGHGLITTGASGGTFRLEWAQNVSNANAVNILLQSYARFWKLN